MIRKFIVGDLCSGMRALFLTIALIAGDLLAADLFVNPDSESPAAPFDTPETAALNISDAVSLATDGDTVYFAPGTYNLTSIVMVSNDIAFVSTNPLGSVVIDGQSVTRCFNIESSAPEFRGLVIENGASDNGGAMRFAFSAAIISNCIIRSSTANYGGGIYADQSPLTILNSVLSGNAANNTGPSGGINWPQTAGGGLFMKTSDALIKDTVFANNSVTSTGEGGGLAVFHPEQTGDGLPAYAALTTFINCLIISNTSDYAGGGTACNGVNLDDPLTKIRVTFENCRWQENHAQYGGAFYHVNQGTEPVVYNGLFLRNTSGDNGAALRIFDTYYAPGSWTRSFFFNSTFAENESVNNHTIYVSGSVFYMVNNIAWSNRTLSDVRVDATNANWLGAFQEAEYNCLEKDYTGDGILQGGNITNNPVFADTAAGDFRLQADSPCIDTGLTASAISDRDFFGEDRVFGTAVDMGLDEAVVSITAFSNNWTDVSAVCPPGAVFSFQQAGDALLTNWQDLGPRLTSTTGRITYDVSGYISGTGAIRAVWHRW